MMLVVEGNKLCEEGLEVIGGQLGMPAFGGAGADFSARGDEKRIKHPFVV